MGNKEHECEKITSGKLKGHIYGWMQFSVCVYNRLDFVFQSVFLQNFFVFFFWGKVCIVKFVRQNNIYIYIYIYIHIYIHIIAKVFKFFFEQLI